MKTTANTLICLFALAIISCASNGDSNLRIGMGMGSFGSSGGVSVGGSTSVPVGGNGGSNASAELPFVQMTLDDAILTRVYPDKVVPFTASEDDVAALAKYVDSGAEPQLDEALRNNLEKCVASEAQCRIKRTD
ncbi:MAG: hypothetical protein ACR2QG_02105 [Gammaproteobacteria bacterium]